MTELNSQEYDHLIEIGLTKRIINNYLKKGFSYDKILKGSAKKIAELEAKKYLLQRLGKEMKMPKVSLPPCDKFISIDVNQKLEVKFPILPSVNHMYMTTSFGGKQMTPETKVLFLQLQDYIREEVEKQEWQGTHGIFIIAELKFYMPDKRKRDSHNMFKFLFDIMNGIVYDDDYYVLPQVLDIQIDKENPRIECKLKIKSD